MSSPAIDENSVTAHAPSTTFTPQLPHWLNTLAHWRGVPNGRKLKEYAKQGLKSLEPCDLYRPLPGPDAGNGDTSLDFERQFFETTDIPYDLHEVFVFNPEGRECLNRCAGDCDGDHAAIGPSVIRELCRRNTLEAMASVAYGSNYIGRVGASLLITRGLCIWGVVSVPASVVPLTKSLFLVASLRRS